MKCRHFALKHCLSCDLLSHDYQSSIAVKEQALSRLLPQHVDSIKKTIICESELNGARNKSKLAVALVGGEVEFGFYNHAMQFKQLEDCPLHAPAINSALVDLKKLIQSYHITPYDLASKKGELKYILLTYSESTDELLLRFVLRSKEALDRLRKLTVELSTLHSKIKVVTANIQATHQAILEGDEEIVLTDRDSIAHYFDEYTLFQGPRSFFQTNTDVALKLYRQFQQELSGLSVSSFLDLYCGVGAFSFFAAKHCDQVVGVEISDAAIQYANQARSKNNGENIRFSALDVEMFLKDQQPGCFDAIMVNPPRRGLNNEIIEHLIRLSSEYLFYSSCNAETLQRDLMQLEKEYKVLSLQIFDMFPFTSHFETLAVLKRESVS